MNVKTLLTLGVEPEEIRNKDIYIHYGFVEHIKNAKEVFPYGTKIDVEYYGKKLNVWMNIKMNIGMLGNFQKF